MNNTIDFIEHFSGKNISINNDSVFKLQDLKQVKQAKQTYNDSKVSYQVLLDHYLLVRTKKEEISIAYNPAEVLHNNEYQGPESGETAEDSSFKVAALNLKEIDSMTTIAGMFYGSERDDAPFELSCYLPYVDDMIKSAKRTLVVNPSPHMLAKLKKTNRKISCIVTDDTVASLYKLDYKKADFYTFEDLIKHLNRGSNNTNSLAKSLDLGLYELILVTARDYKITQIIQAFSLGNYKGRIIALMPENVLARKEREFAKQMRECGMQINGILLLHGKMLGSSPKYKMMMDISISNQYKDHEIPVLKSSYDPAKKELQVFCAEITIKSSLLMKPIKLRQKLRSLDPTKENKPKQNYNVRTYHLTEAILLSYNIPGGKRQGKYIYIYYKPNTKEGKLIGEQIKNKKVIKVMRSNPNDEYIEEIERASLDGRIRPKVIADLLNEYENRYDELSFKDLWFICYDDLLEISFREIFAEFLFFNPNRSLAKLKPSKASGNDIRSALMSLLTPKDGRGIKYLKTLNTICKMARKKGLLFRNPVLELLEEESREASREEREIRNANVKKTFEISEEVSMINFLLEPESGEVLPKCITSGYWFMALIRLLTGISLGEASALVWDDYRHNSTGVSYLHIEKYVDYAGKFIHYDASGQETRSLDKEISTFLDRFIMQRRDYLIIECGMNENRLTEMLMVLDYAQPDPNSAAIRGKLRDYCQLLIEQAKIPELILEIPTEDGTKETDVNQYSGDIFRSNFILKAKLAGYTEGELDHSVGLTSYRPFEHNYCDFYNDMSIYIRACKLARWTCLLENESMFTQPTYEKYTFEKQNTVQVVGKGNMVPTTDIITNVTNSSPKSKIHIGIESNHGVQGHISVIEKKGSK